MVIVPLIVIRLSAARITRIGRKLGRPEDHGAPVRQRVCGGGCFRRRVGQPAGRVVGPRSDGRQMTTINFLHGLWSQRGPPDLAPGMTAPDPHSRAPLVAALGALVCAGAVAVASAGAPPEVAFGRGLLQFLIIAVPIATGLYALRAPVGPSLGIAMLATGFLWSLTALAETSWSVTYTVGRVSTWLVFPCVAYLLLAFPSGRIASRLDRVVLLGVLGVLVLLFLGTAPLVQAFPLNTLWATCTTDCPANALLVLDRQPAFLDE